MEHKSMLATTAAALVLALASTATNAHGVRCGDLTITHPYSAPSLGAHKTSAVYFISIRNDGKGGDQLLSARTDLSSSTEIHRMSLENDIMRMRAVSEVPLPAGFEVSFRHGQANGYHLMLLDLARPLKAGDRFPVTLTFARAGECKVEVWVEAPKPEAHKH